MAPKRSVEAGGVEMRPLFSASPPQMLVGGHRTDFLKIPKINSTLSVLWYTHK